MGEVLMNIKNLNYRPKLLGFLRLNSTYNITMYYYMKMNKEKDEDKRFILLDKLIDKLKCYMSYSFVCDYKYDTDFYCGDWDSLYSDLFHYSDRFNFQRLNKIATFTLIKKKF